MLKKLSAIIFVSLSFLFFTKFASAQIVPTPIMDKVESNLPVITGSSSLGTEVLIYIDDKFINFAQVKISNDNLAENFYYQGTKDLTLGNHK